MKINFKAITLTGFEALMKTYKDLTEEKSKKRLKKYKIELAFNSDEKLLTVEFTNKAFTKIAGKMPGVLNAIAEQSIGQHFEPSLEQYKAVKLVDYSTEVII